MATKINLKRIRTDFDAQIKDHVRIGGHLSVSDRATIQHDALREGYTAVYGNAVLGSYSYLKDGVSVRDYASVHCRCWFSNIGKNRIPNLYGKATVQDDAQVLDRASMDGNSIAVEHVGHIAETMQIDYEVGFNEYKSKWVCPEHNGWAPLSLSNCESPGNGL